MKTEEQEILENIYNTAIECGKTPEEARELMAMKCTVLDSLDVPALEKKLKIRRQLAVKDLSTIESFNKDNQRRYLWKLGFNTEEYFYWFDVVVYKRDTKTVVEKVIVGQERTDDEWVNLRINGIRVASFEAQVANKEDPSFTHEINKMMRGK